MAHENQALLEMLEDFVQHFDTQFLHVINALSDLDPSRKDGLQLKAWRSSRRPSNELRRTASFRKWKSSFDLGACH
eukprot:CAMPEP_0169268190 /NCGR_PEP_ID=MMETSP1016-20121227/47643_1 /TAXON_ID=342587 /ORGANISM="Karlodinium micrum, Strain CCMP2283" /LENGTH=75 /DNA_ID=CAMNT_0009352835 /DNA_START=237 /DNA_END=461 /DNA_ORIENTATION=+